MISALTFTEQKLIKPKIVDIIDECLTGEMKQSALDFVAYVTTMKMPPRWSNRNAWVVNFKGKGVCKITMQENGWFIRPSAIDDSDDALMMFCVENKLEEVLWDNIYHCRGCRKSPADCMQKTKTVLGKEFKAVCSCVLFQFHNPNSAAIKCIKQLVDFRMASTAQS